MHTHTYANTQIHTRSNNKLNNIIFCHISSLFVLWKNIYLLTSNKVQLYYTEINSRYFICRVKQDK